MADLPPKLTPAPQPVPLPVAGALQGLEQAIFGAYANTSDRAEAFQQLADLQGILQRAATRASLTKAQSPDTVEGR